jgi:hypothetical protein
MLDNTRIAFDEERGMTTILRHPDAEHPDIPGDWERCPTCGRAWECCCEEPYQYSQGTALTRAALVNMLTDAGMEEVH